MPPSTAPTFEPLEPRLLLAAAEAVWIEGEAPAADTFNRHGWYVDDHVSLDLVDPGIDIRFIGWVKPNRELHPQTVVAILIRTVAEIAWSGNGAFLGL